MRRVTATLTAALLGISVWTCGLGTASADPAPPVDPVIPLPVPADPAALPADPAPEGAQSTLLGQFAQAAQLDPFGTMQQMLGSAPQQAMLGAPPAPGTSPGPDPISLALTMNPRNFRMPTDDQVSPYALAPNDNPSLFDRVNAFKGVHAIVHSNLGRMPGDQLGQPLPGTAAPSGSNLPAGLEQFYIAPAAVPADAAAIADPLLLPLEPPAPSALPAAPAPSALPAAPAPAAAPPS